MSLNSNDWWIIRAAVEDLMDKHYRKEDREKFLITKEVWKKVLTIVDSLNTK